MVVATRLLLLLAIAGASLAQQRSLSTSTRRRNRLPAGKSEVLDFSCPEDFGYYQHPTDCTQYYVCVFGGALQESCSGGLVYSHDLQTCDWPRNVVCNVDLAGPVSTVRITDPRTSEPPRQRAQGQSLTPSVSSNGFAETFRTSAGRSQDQQQSGPSSTAVNRQGRIIQGQSDVKQQQPIREKFQGQESTNRAFSIPQTTSRSFSFPWMKELGQKRDQVCCSGTLRLDEDNRITRRRRRSISPALDSHDKMAASSSVDRPDVDSETSPSARYSTFARPDRPNNRHSVNADATSLPGLSLLSDSSDSTLFSDRRLTSPSNKPALDFFSLDSIEEDLDSQQSRYFGDESYQRSEVGFQGPLRRRRRRPYYGKNRIRAVGPSAFSFHGSNNQFHGPNSVRFPPQIVNPFQPQYHKPSEEIPRQKESILQTYPRDEINSNEFPPSLIEKSKNKIPSSFSSLSSGSPFSHFLISHSTNGGLEVNVPGSDRPKPMPQAINPFDGRQPVHDYTFPDDDRPEYVDRPAYVNIPEQADRPEYVDRPSHVDRPSYEERTPYENRPTNNERPRYEKRPVHNKKPSNEARQPQYQSSQHEKPVSQQKGEYLPNPSYEAEHDRNRDKQAEDDRHNRPYVPYNSHTSRITTPPPIQPNPTKYTVGYQNFNSQEQQSPEKSFPMFHAPVSSPKRQPGPFITHTPPPRSEEYNRPPYAPPQFSRPSKGDDGFLLPTPGTTFHEELETPLTLYDDEEDKTGIENYFYHTDEPRPYLPISYEQEPVTRSGPDENVYYKTSAERHPFRQPSLSVERPISPPIDSYKKQSPELSYEDQGPLPPSRDQYSSVQQDDRTPGPPHESTESTPFVRNRKPLPPYRNRRPELVSEDQESEPFHTEKPSDERITEAPRRTTRPKIQVPRRSHRPKTPTEATTTPSTTRAPPFKPFSMPPFKKPTSVRERGGSRHKTTLAAKPIHIPGTARHPDFSKLSAADDSSSTSDSVFSTSDQRKTQDERPNYRGSQQSQSVTPAPVELETNFYSDLLNLTDDEYFYLYDDLLLEDYFDATATTTTPRSVARSPIRTNTKSSSQPQGKVSTDSSRPARLTVKPVSEVLKNTNHLISNVWKYPPRRPASLYPTPPVNSIANKCDRKACRLPDCNCGGKEVPGGLAPQDVPQLVMLTFDDSVNDLNKELYQDLFERGRTNPNGCPLAATFYVSHEWTDYSQVQNLYADGHEIASHSVTHSFGEQFSKLKWAKEIAGQREIMAAYGGVNMEDIRGMRAPFLAVGGNKMFEMLYEQNFTYDSSMPVYENRPPSYPYTLDYKLFHDCMIPPCPTNSFPGLWEVPMVMWQDLNGGRCSMGDACTTPPDAEGVYKMLIKNFERHYTTNRAPMGLFYHAAWFTTAHHKEGFIAFLDTISGMPDVWLVTNWQALQWVRDPVPLSQAKTFKPFECNYPGRPARCKSHKVCNVWHKGGVRYMRTCQRCPEAYPWVGATGVDSPLNDI